MWIRSQEGMSLRQYDGIFINYQRQTEICGDSKSLEIDSDESYFVLGRYESKERALEVLDEIQNKIVYIELVKIGEANPINKDYFIYEMPEE